MTEQFEDVAAGQPTAHEGFANSPDGASPADANPSPPAGQATEINPDIDAIEGALSVSELGMASLGPTLRDDAHDFMAAGLAYEKSFPEQSAKLMEKMAADPELFALAFQYLARQGREQRLANPTSRKDGTVTEHYVPPSKRQALQDRLDEIYQQHPVGSESYKSAKVQREVAALNSALHGDLPADRGVDPSGLSTR